MVNESDEKKLYNVRFLVSSTSWRDIKEIFSKDLGIIKDKKDDSVIPMRDHYIVEIGMTENDLTDTLYKKVDDSAQVTILSDESSIQRAKDVLNIVAPIELKVRELAVYAYDLAETYQDIMNLKYKNDITRRLLKDNKLVTNNTLDPLLSFLDFGELVIFLGKTGNQVDESNLADTTARLLEDSTSFADFKRAFAQKYKKLTVWDIIAKAVLVQEVEWQTIKDDLNLLKDLRNSAFHHRVVTPAMLEEARGVSGRLLSKLETKKLSSESSEMAKMGSMFEKWNSALMGYESAYQRALANIAKIDTSAIQKATDLQLSTGMLQRIFEVSQLSSRPLQQALVDWQQLSPSYMDNTLRAIKNLGLSSWISEDVALADDDGSNRNDSGSKSKSTKKPINKEKNNENKND